jgi:hypothetical protein
MLLLFCLTLWSLSSNFIRVIVVCDLLALIILFYLPLHCYFFYPRVVSLLR